MEKLFPLVLKFSAYFEFPASNCPQGRGFSGFLVFQEVWYCGGNILEPKVSIDTFLLCWRCGKYSMLTGRSDSLWQQTGLSNQGIEARRSSEEQFNATEPAVLST
jgi:hypothetical protein